MRKGFLIYEEMHKYFHNIWGEEVVSHIWLCTRSLWKFSNIWGNFLSFLSVLCKRRKYVLCSLQYAYLTSSLLHVWEPKQWMSWNSFNFFLHKFPFLYAVFSMQSSILRIVQDWIINISFWLLLAWKSIYRRNLDIVEKTAKIKTTLTGQLALC
jgi:hypothetical protein